MVAPARAFLRGTPLDLKRVTTGQPVLPRTTTGVFRRRRPRRQRHFVGDGLAGALHHERQRHNMGLTIPVGKTTL